MTRKNIYKCVYKKNVLTLGNISKINYITFVKRTVLNKVALKLPMYSYGRNCLEHNNLYI